MIDITGVDWPMLLAALYNGTRAQGMGFLHDRQSLSWDEAYHYLSSTHQWPRAQVDFDYVYGRPIKVSLHNDGSRAVLRGEGVYERDSLRKVSDIVRALGGPCTNCRMPVESHLGEPPHACLYSPGTVFTSTL